MNDTTLDREQRGWVRLLMRLGYSGRGVVYGLVGVLGLLAVLNGGRADGTQSALVELRDMPFGAILLCGLALGLLAYAAWRFINAALDLDRYGDDAKGLFSRFCMVVVGIIHLAFAFAAVSVAFRFTGGDGESGMDAATRALFEWPFGRYIVAGIGLATIGGGLFFIWRAWSRDYEKKVVRNPVTERLDLLMAFGMFAHGVVVAMIGIFFVTAAWTFSAEKAGGMQQALDRIRDWPFGDWLLGATAIGFIGFAVACFMNAAYRVVPANIGRDDDRTVLTGEPAREVI